MSDADDQKPDNSAPEVSKAHVPNTDANPSIEKSALETDKLLLETRLLQRQLSVQGFLMGWLQAASVPVALLGAFLAFFVGFGQLRQGADSQAADRFDKTLTRLASQRPAERMTGVSGLNLFLRDDNVGIKGNSCTG